MNRWTNLLPLHNQLSFERKRQLRVWGVAWLAVSLALAAVYGILERQRIQLVNSMASADASVASVHAAVKTLDRLKEEKQTLQRLSSTAEALQQIDAPLALLQAVGTSCHDFGKKIQIDSLRMDEFGLSNSPRKQLKLVGSAEADYLITAFVDRLNSVGVFRKVELESSHAVVEGLVAKRTFQILCQQ